MDDTHANESVLEAIAVDVLSTWSNRIQIAGVNWKVLPGEYWVIGGRNGSGKTDLLLTAAGLRQPAAGTVRIFGRETAGISEAELLRQRTRIGFVFKGGGRMFNELTVAENVALALCYHRNWSAEEAREEVHALLEITELSDLANETAQTLGTDWQQRVGLARALALKPDVMFLDEPAAGLEARHREWWRNFLAQWFSRTPVPGRGKSTVITTANDFAPWHEKGRQYALIKDRRCHVLGEQAEHPQIE
jgi:ABC-type sulfate/molybdate transport systems ATPase subunit